MKTPIEHLISTLQFKHDHFLGIDGEEARKNFKQGLAYSITTADSYLSKEKELLEALKQVTFTARKLWDDSKPLKDMGAVTFTHPIIEEARVILEKYNIKIPKS